MPTSKASPDHRLPTSPASRRIAAFARAAANSAGVDQNLLEGARQLLSARYRMDRLLPKKDLQRHAVWSVLFELYVNSAEGGITHVKQAMIATGETPGTAIRTLGRLEEEGLIRREPDAMDRRRLIVRLTDAGRQIVVSLLTGIFEPARQTQGTQAPVAFRPRH